VLFSEQSPKLLLYSVFFAIIFYGIVFLCANPVFGEGIDATFWSR